MEHCLHSTRCVRLAAAGNVTLRRQCCGYLTQRHPLPVQFLRQRHRRWHPLRIGEAPTSTASCCLLAFPRSPQLGDQGGFLKLRDGTKHLAHEHRSRRVLNEEIRRDRGDKLHPERLEIVVACQLNRQIAREPVRALNQDDAHEIDRHGTITIVLGEPSKDNGAAASDTPESIIEQL